MRLCHNTMSLNTYRNYAKSLENNRVASERISSGIKLNKAKDDPNNLAKAERMSIQVRGLQMASRNIQDGASMLQTADGGMNSIKEYIQRIRELTIQSGGTATDDDKAVIQTEIKGMLSGINDVAKNTEFNGVTMLGATNQDASIPYDNNNPNVLKPVIGANGDERLDIPMYNLSPDVLGGDVGDLKLKDVNVGSKTIDENLTIIDNALETVRNAAGKYGALSNRLESTFNITSDVSGTIEKAESGLRDADIASEMIEFTRTNLLKDAGIAMMAQSNNFPNDVLKILERVK